MNKFQSDLQKAKILLTIVTIDGTLYEGDIVKIERPENGDYRDNLKLLNKK